jgi:hypothetical protein
MEQFLATFSGFHQTVFSFLAVHSPQQLFSQLTTHNIFFHSHGPTKQALSNYMHQTRYHIYFPLTVQASRASHTCPKLLCMIWGRCMEAQVDDVHRCHSWRLEKVTVPLSTVSPQPAGLGGWGRGEELPKKKWCTCALPGTSSSDPALSSVPFQIPRCGSKAPATPVRGL